MKIDLQKRRRVMQRSQRLGHCICDAHRPCPCDLLREKNFCPCAGERLETVDVHSVKLTQLTRNAGCASKIAPSELDAVLARLPAVEDPAVLSGLAAADDAAIYRISSDAYLVQTVDVFTPCVDSPQLFGKICAANCLSDIYAMGGEPRTALSVLAFPSETLPGEIIYQMLAGAMEVFKQAGVALIGGHSIKDAEIKLGFAITGLIDPKTAAALERPAPGDILILTKPLGTGVLSFCRQIGRNLPKGFAEADASMLALNKDAAEAMREAGASACTDITGFGLFAHLMRMLRPANLSAHVFADALPAFAGVLDAIREGVAPGAIERNREYVGERLEVEPGVDQALIELGLDAQTSGGLLIAIAPERLPKLRSALEKRNVPAFVLGHVTNEAGGIVRLSPNISKAPEFASTGRPPAESRTPMPMNSSDSSAHHEGCCVEAFNAPASPATATNSQQAFASFMQSVQSGGALSEKAKELILFSLVLQSRCHPCFQTHYEKARRLGITQAEMDEAAWCAIAMGGAPVRMFYQECLKSVSAS